MTSDFGLMTIKPDYLKWNELTVDNFSPANISALYNEGYLFTRLGRGVMNQTRSLRIDLSKFELTSENRRILRKTNDLRFTICDLPYQNYDWSIAKLAKDFYDTKFGKEIFSANKMKELLTDESRSNFNLALKYSVILHPDQVGMKNLFTGKRSASTDPSPRFGGVQDDGRSVIGYAICYENDDILHYSYPFYDLSNVKGQPPPAGGVPPTAGISNMGLGMMLRAILYAKEGGKKYTYLGSAQRPSDIYKLQFTGLEWFDGGRWQQNIQALKDTLDRNTNLMN